MAGFGRRGSRGAADALRFGSGSADALRFGSGSFGSGNGSGDFGSGKQGRRGVFVLSLYEDVPLDGVSDYGPLRRMALWPSGPVSVSTALAVVGELASVQADILADIQLADIQAELLHRVKKLEQGGPLDEDRLAAAQSEGRKGSVFDASA